MPNNMSKNDITNVLKQDHTNKIMGNFNKLPKDILISTMTITCKLGTNINLENVAKYVDLSMAGIRSIRYGCKPEYTRILVEKKKKTKKVKKKKSFFNQATLEIKPSNNNAINVKLFKNGSVQMTGCKSIKNAYEILTILINQLKIEKATLTDGVITEKKYVYDHKILKVSDFKIVMINSNFKVDYKIDREVLYNILKKDGITCTYEPCIHACVNIKFNYFDDNKIISIFVFQSGAIIITGANNTKHIISAYEYINKKLKDNYDQIVKKKVDIARKNNQILNNYLKSNFLKCNTKTLKI